MCAVSVEELIISQVAILSFQMYFHTLCLCVQPVWVPVALLVHYACGGASVGGVRGGACGRGRGLAQDLGRALHLPVPGVLVSLALSEQEAMVPLPTSHDVMFTISWQQQQEVWQSHEQLTDANIRSF